MDDTYNRLMAHRKDVSNLASIYWPGQGEDNDSSRKRKQSRDTKMTEALYEECFSKNEPFKLSEFGQE